MNFDVFGNVSHQAQTRLYFDLIRNGAEQNFLRLMPVDARRRCLTTGTRTAAS
ncbi:fatty acid cis/trans isomerase [Pseudomonas aeruginosa]|nr:fatty acid cis/trans isomerase [Pseudomonas aeruginosa]